MSFIKKLQRQPENIRKIILWNIVVIVGLGLSIWWIHSSYWRIKKFPKEEFMEKVNLPNFEDYNPPATSSHSPNGEWAPELPKIEMPELDEDKLKKLKEEMEKGGEKLE